MEGVGARTGRSSSRYGTTTVFNGPVRKWKKDWVPIPPPSSSSSSSSNSNQNHHPSNNNNNNHSSTNGNVNGSSVSHLRLYKWTPINKDNSSNDNDNTNIKISNNNDDDTNGTKNSANDDVVSDEPRKKKFKYIPIALLEEQKETEENLDIDKSTNGDENTGEQASKSDGNDEKPDINDVPMEENEADGENQAAPARQDLNELDLSLG
ncbi:unnamed protein product [Amaranthus hypochondriacus]